MADQQALRDGSRVPTLLAESATTSGETVRIKADPATNSLNTTLGTTLAGEDVPNDVLKVEQRFNYANISTATTTTLKSGVGVLHAVVITNPGATSNSIKIYDNTAASGSVIVDWSTSGGTPAAGSFTFDVSFTVGLTIVTAGTTSPNLTVCYR